MSWAASYIRADRRNTKKASRRYVMVVVVVNYIDGRDMVAGKRRS